RIENVEHTLVRLELELLSRILVHVRRAEHRPPLRLCRQRNRPRHLRARLLLVLVRCGNRPRHLRASLLSRPHDVGGRLIDDGVIERLETDADSTSHVLSLVRWEPGRGNRELEPNDRLPVPGSQFPTSYFKILVTTPAPTVRPPSRIANRSCSSIAIGVINSIVIWMLSPGITISVPAGNSTDPVTSVVRK